MLMRLTFRSPLSTELTYVLCNPARAASSSCERDCFSLARRRFSPNRRWISSSSIAARFAVRTLCVYRLCAYIESDLTGAGEAKKNATAKRRRNGLSGGKHLISDTELGSSALTLTVFSMQRR